MRARQFTELIWTQINAKQSARMQQSKLKRAHHRDTARTDRLTAERAQASIKARVNLTRRARARIYQSSMRHQGP